MDTDDLSEETYRAIIDEADRFDRCLTLQFGVIASSCQDEDEYIKTAIELINAMRSCDENDLERIFFGDFPAEKSFHTALTKISDNIEEIKKRQV